MFAPRRGGFKKRRGFKKRGRKVQSATSKSGFARAVGTFKSRRVSARRFRSNLWNSTLFKSHYRSVYGTSVVESTNVAANVGNVNGTLALHPDANLFWTGAGGANPLDVGGGIPGFNGDIIIRGGIIGMTLANDLADTTSQKIKVFLVKTGKAFDLAGFPTSVQVGWDPTIFPDFTTNIGRVLLSREVLLENVNSVDITYRLPVMKIEQVDFTLGKDQFFWILIGNSPSGTSATYTRTAYFNLSFSGDT